MNAIAPSSASATGPALDNRRVIAALIDLVVVVVGTVLLSTIVGIITGGDAAWGPQMALVSLAWALYYYFALESGDGQTLGKKVMKLRVVRADGGATSMREIAIRTVLRVVDGIMVYLVGLVVMMITGERRQRLGDIAAGTIVVDASAAPAPAAPAAMAPPVMAPPQEAPAEDAGERAPDSPAAGEPSFPVASSGPADVGSPLPGMSAPENPAPPAVQSFNPFADPTPAPPAAEEPTAEVHSVEPVAPEQSAPEPAEPETFGHAPDASPSVEPSVEPASAHPSVESADEPTEPSVEPAASYPSVEPADEPSVEPSVEPTVEPAAESSDVHEGFYPTGQPIEEPEPSVQPAAASDEPPAESSDVPEGFYPTGQPIEEPTVEAPAEPDADEPAPAQPSFGRSPENGSDADEDDDEQPTVSVKSVETVSAMDLIMGDDEDEESSPAGRDDGPASA